MGWLHNSLELVHNRAPSANFFGAGSTTDLTDILTKANENAPCTILLDPGVAYVWPDGVVWPLGVSLIGFSGFDNDKISVSRDYSFGTVIQQASGNRIEQSQVGPHDSTQICEGILFADGLEVKKQHGLFLQCRFDNNGLKIGDTGTTAYYNQFVNCIYNADDNKNSIECGPQCNANNFSGSLFVPSGGRGIQMTGVSASGNRFELSVDTFATDAGAALWCDGGVDNYIDFFRFEFADQTTWTDGAHIAFINNAQQNVVDIGAASVAGSAGLKVYYGNSGQFNDVRRRDGSNRSLNGDLTWDYGWADNMMVRTANNVYLPPTNMRRGKLSLRTDVEETTVHAAYACFNLTINAAGSGGVDGTYIQEYTDGNVVTGQEVVMRITISGGVMTAVDLLYSGWFTAALAATVNVTVGSLTGGVVNLLDTPYQVWDDAGKNSMVIRGNQETTFQADPISSRWFANNYPTIEASAANIASSSNGINTSNKYPDKMVWDTTNNRMMRARGSSATAVWDVVDGSASVTPA